MNHSKMFEKIKRRYEKNYITHEQLEEYLNLEVITIEEFYEITGETPDE